MHLFVLMQLLWGSTCRQLPVTKSVTNNVKYSCWQNAEWCHLLCILTCLSSKKRPSTQQMLPSVHVLGLPTWSLSVRSTQSFWNALYHTETCSLIIMCSSYTVTSSLWIGSVFFALCMQELNHTLHLHVAPTFQPHRHCHCFAHMLTTFTDIWPFQPVYLLWIYICAAMTCSSGCYNRHSHHLTTFWCNTDNGVSLP